MRESCVRSDALATRFLPSPASILAYIALGSNLGDRAKHIDDALDQLKQTEGVRVLAVSKLLENPAVGGPENAPAFLNAAAEVQTTLDAHALLHRLMEIEKSLGRRRRVKWEPRPIDLDLLLYGDQIIDSPDLIVPHPLMHQRRFVLQPLAEIAANHVHPILRVTIAELLVTADAGV